MMDPTYNPDEIKSSPVWYAAWVMSECLNDSAPIGWSNYIWVAEKMQQIFQKDKHE